VRTGKTVAEHCSRWFDLGVAEVLRKTWEIKEKRKVRRSAMERKTMKRGSGRTEVGENDVTVEGDEDVLRLEVAVNNTGAVKTLDTFANLRHVEPRTIPPQSTPASELRRKVAAGVEVECEEERVFVAEGIVELDDERVGLVPSAPFQDGLLGAGVQELSMSENLRREPGLAISRARKAQRKKEKRERGRKTNMTLRNGLQSQNRPDPLLLDE
jgi:hypothetical protein